MLINVCYIVYCVIFYVVFSSICMYFYNDSCTGIYSLAYLKRDDRGSLLLGNTQSWDSNALAKRYS